jgi:3-deoxy-D-manno-octulosonic-acid transferase
LTVPQKEGFSQNPSFCGFIHDPRYNLLPAIQNLTSAGIFRLPEVPAQPHCIQIDFMIRRQFNDRFDRLYEAGWRFVMPLLRLSSRLKDGYEHRLHPGNLPAADIWIQAASAGEAYLACSLLESFKPIRPVRVLITSNTRQGLDIIDHFISSEMRNNAFITAFSAFFPFDRPTLMAAAVGRVNPKVMVLLETEIWPGLLSALKNQSTRILIINGRLTARSLRGYQLLKSLWHQRAPDRVLAISSDDALRFRQLFGAVDIQCMPNIKFDRLNIAIRNADNSLEKLLPEAASFLVLGSIRQEEEPLVENLIREVRRRSPRSIIGLFPRHMHRVNHWAGTLRLMNVPWMLRSEADQRPFPAGRIILWDRFGELHQAYGRARSVFVGGSLAPLGGQNFLEPLVYGIRPVIGPYWDHFAWVGDDIIRQGLVIKTKNWQDAAAVLVDQLHRPEPREPVQEAAMQYIRERSGGTRRACDAMLAALTAAQKDREKH